MELVAHLRVSRLLWDEKPLRAGCGEVSQGFPQPGRLGLEMVTV